MKKIKLKQVIKHIYKQELEEFKDPESWWDCTKEEKAEAVKEFKEEWSGIETIEDLIRALTVTTTDDKMAAVDMILQAVIEEFEE
jgi:hypothetical protein